MSSIRSRLTAYILTGLIALLLLAGFFIEHLIRVRLSAEFDESLLAKARLLVTLTEQEPDKIEFDFDSDVMLEYSRNDAPEYFQLQARDGKIIASSESFADWQLPGGIRPTESPAYIDTTLPDNRRGRMVFFEFLPKYDDDTDEQDEQTERTQARELRSAKNGSLAKPDPVQLHMYVAKGTEQLDELLAVIRSIFIVTFLALLASVVVLVHLAIKRGLGPLNSIVDQVQRLDATKLQTRITGAAGNKELLPIVDQLNDLLDRLGAAFQREKRFSGNVAHELRTPIAELRAVAEVGKKWPSDEKMVSGFFSDLLDLADDMERTVTNLLTLARLDAGQAEIALERVDLHQLVGKIWKQVIRDADAKQIVLDNKIRPGLQIQTDKNKLVLILANLFTNSISYSPQGSTIFVNTEEREGRIHFSVSNQTMDLTENDISLMFERFWRKEQVNQEGHHAGLGLALVKALAELLNLKISSKLDGHGRLTMIMQGLPIVL